MPTPNFISSVRVFTFSNYTRGKGRAHFFNLDRSVSVSVDRLKGSLGETVSGKSMYCSEVHGGDRGWALGQRLRTT